MGQIIQGGGGKVIGEVPGLFAVVFAIGIATGGAGTYTAQRLGAAQEPSGAIEYSSDHMQLSADERAGLAFLADKAGLPVANLHDVFCRADSDKDGEAMWCDVVASDNSRHDHLKLTDDERQGFGPLITRGGFEDYTSAQRIYCHLDKNEAGANALYCDVVGRVVIGKAEAFDAMLQHTGAHAVGATGAPR